MSTEHTLRGQANQLLRLTEEERQNPYLVLEEFYSSFHLVDIRAILWDWLVAALSSESGAYLNGYARSNLIFVYEKLEMLIEAANEINKRRKRKLKWKFRKLESKT
jgi:hypothetical protein